MAVDVKKVIEEARDVVAGRRVYSEPYERNGVTVILASQVGGGGGGGGGEGEGKGDNEGSGKGWGGGFGMSARPVGAFVIHGEDVRFVPTVDVNRIISGAQIVAVAALLTLRTVVKVRARRRRR